ncbi:hypothetical protein PR048_027940 [Dryococelus australis]|uniref:Uncharacterized protein n=1 Tax=Dryococelus australis TaxID=614101 RepID=A0ABQ9GHY0_9NEOP|nr:hypothetical protein PR048_027940 [Dryococelus australis]
MIRSPLKVPQVHAALREHCTSVQSHELSGDSANVALMALALLGQKRRKTMQAGGPLKAQNSQISPQVTFLTDCEKTQKCSHSPPSHLNIHQVSPHSHLFQIERGPEDMLPTDSEVQTVPPHYHRMHTPSKLLQHVFLGEEQARDILPTTSPPISALGDSNTLQVRSRSNTLRPRLPSTHPYLSCPSSLLPAIPSPETSTPAPSITHFSIPALSFYKHSPHWCKTQANHRQGHMLSLIYCQLQPGAPLCGEVEASTADGTIFPTRGRSNLSIIPPLIGCAGLWICGRLPRAAKDSMLFGLPAGCRFSQALFSNLSLLKDAENRALGANWRTAFQYYSFAGVCGWSFRYRLLFHISTLNYSVLPKSDGRTRRGDSYSCAAEYFLLETNDEKGKGGGKISLADVGGNPSNFSRCPNWFPKAAPTRERLPDVQLSSAPLLSPPPRYVYLYSQLRIRAGGFANFNNGGVARKPMGGTRRVRHWRLSRDMSMKQRRSVRAGGNGRSPRSPGHQRHRPARLQRAKGCERPAENRAQFAMDRGLSTNRRTPDWVHSGATKLVRRNTTTLRVVALNSCCPHANMRTSTSPRDKIDIKRVYTEAAFAIGAYFIIHALDDSSPMADFRQTGFNPRPGHSRFSQAGIVQDDAAGWRVFSRIFRFPRASILTLLHIHLASPSSALKTSVLGTQVQVLEKRKFMAGKVLRKFSHTADILELVERVSAGIRRDTGFTRKYSHEGQTSMSYGIRAVFLWLPATCLCRETKTRSYNPYLTGPIRNRTPEIATTYCSNHRARPLAETPSTSQLSGTWTPKRRTDIGHCKAGPGVFPHPTSSQGRIQHGYVRPPSSDQLETATGLGAQPIENLPQHGVANEEHKARSQSFTQPIRARAERPHEKNCTAISSAAGFAGACRRAYWAPSAERRMASSGAHRRQWFTVHGGVNSWSDLPPIQLQTSLWPGKLVRIAGALQCCQRRDTHLHQAASENPLEPSSGAATLARSATQ